MANLQVLASICGDNSPIYQVNGNPPGETVPPGESQVMYNKDWEYVRSSEPQTLRQALNFIDVSHVPFRKRKAKWKKKVSFMRYISFTAVQYRWFFQSRLNVKMCGFFSQFYVHVNRIFYMFSSIYASSSYSFNMVEKNV